MSIKVSFSVVKRCLDASPQCCRHLATQIDDCREEACQAGTPKLSLVNLNLQVPEPRNTRKCDQARDSAVAVQREHTGLRNDSGTRSAVLRSQRLRQLKRKHGMLRFHDAVTSVGTEPASTEAAQSPNHSVDVQ